MAVSVAVEMKTIFIVYSDFCCLDRGPKRAKAQPEIVIYLKHLL